MNEALLATTSSQGLQPLGTAAQRSFELVSGTVRARLGDAHAGIFAEPVAARHGDSIDWYAPMPGTGLPLSELTPEDARAVKAALAALVADIQAEADELAASDIPEDQRLAEALANAIELPDETMIHALRDASGVLHPVLVHWGWIRDEQKAVRGVLTGMVPRAGTVPTPGTAAAAGAGAGMVASGPVAATPPGGVPTGLWWALILLGWLLLAVLLGWLLALLITPCGLAQGRISFCPAPAPPVVSVAESERRVIEDEIARLQRELALLDRTCQPTVPLPLAPVPGIPAPDGDGARPPASPVPDLAPDGEEAAREEAGRRVEERGAARGDLNFALEWASIDDIDLYVTCPTGETLSYLRRTACNGSYDLDANVARRTAVADPVENIVFNDPAPGLYKLRVHLRGIRSEGAIPFALHVLRRSGQSQTFSGVLGENDRVWTRNIEIAE